MLLKPSKVISELLAQAEAVTDEAMLGGYKAETYEALFQAAEEASKSIPLAKDLPHFIISQFDGLYAQGHFEIALRDELGQDIRRWPNLG